MLVEEFQTEMNAITDEVVHAFGSLSAVEINYKPSAKVWSVAQNIEHLIKVNDSYLPILTEIGSGRYKTSFMGKIKWWVNMCGRLILKSVEPARTKKTNTFPIWQPAISDSSEYLLDDYKENQQKIINQVNKQKDVIDNGIVISSPANKNVVYTASKALEIIIDHAKRHIAQANEILPLLASND